MNVDPEQLPQADSSGQEDMESCGCGGHEAASPHGGGCCVGAPADAGSSPDCSCSCSGCGTTQMGALSIGVISVGALALGALSVGALAIGVLAIRRLKIHRSTFDKVHIKNLRVDWLDVGECASID